MKTKEKIVSVHASGQFTLGRQYAGILFQVRYLDSGQILLTPGSFRPAHHETFFTPEAEAQKAEFKEWLKSKPEFSLSVSADTTLMNLGAVAGDDKKQKA